MSYRCVTPFNLLPYPSIHPDKVRCTCADNNKEQHSQLLPPRRRMQRSSGARLRRTIVIATRCASIHVASLNGLIKGAAAVWKNKITSRLHCQLLKVSAHARARIQQTRARSRQGPSRFYWNCTAFSEAASVGSGLEKVAQTIARTSWQRPFQSTDAVLQQSKQFWLVFAGEERRWPAVSVSTPLTRISAITDSSACLDRDDATDTRFITSTTSQCVWLSRALLGAGGLGTKQAKSRCSPLCL